MIKFALSILFNDMLFRPIYLIPLLTFPSPPADEGQHLVSMVSFYLEVIVADGLKPALPMHTIFQKKISVEQLAILNNKMK